MTNLISPMPPPQAGFIPNQSSFKVKNVTGATVPAGAVMYLDLAYADADTASIIPGHNSTAGTPDNVWACVTFVSGASNLQRYGQAVVLLESIAAGAIGMACAVGYVKAIVNGNGVASASTGAILGVLSTTNAAVGNSYHVLVPLTPAVSTLASAASLTFVNGERINGFLLGQSMHSSTVSTLMCDVWFNGLGAGFGNNAL